MWQMGGEEDSERCCGTIFPAGCGSGAAYD